MRLGILVLLLGSIPIVAQNKAVSPSPEVIYSRCKASVVTILTFDKNRAPVSQGSGFIVAKNRILTNYHVLAGMQALLDKKQFDAAHTSFNALSDTVKTTFDGQLLLCRIEQERKEYQLAIYACDAAIKARPNVADPYGLNAYSLLVSGDTERVEFAASKATELSSDAYYKNLLALIYYSEQKYTLIPKELSAESDV
ncbi:MAG: S1C family serine protease [Candidatus Sulfotelmatobacter sp.]